MGEEHKGPKVSVIIPVYNAEKYLTSCVRSVQAQTYKNLEIILVDDGSTDRSGSISEELCKGDGRIRYIVQEHRGVSAARNRALDAHTGEYVFFMDSDDLINRYLLEQYLLCSQDSEADLVFCAYTRFVTLPTEDENAPVFPRPIFFSPQKAWMRFHRGEMSGIGGKFIRSRAIGELRFDESMLFGEDAFFIYQMLSKGSRIALYNAPWYYYRQHPASACATTNNNIGINLEHVRRLRDCEYAGTDVSGRQMVNALKWEKRLLEALQSSYLRAKRARCESLCKDLWDQFLTEKKHPLFMKLPYCERVVFRLCFESQFMYKAVRKGVYLYRRVMRKAASVWRGGRAPVHRVGIKNGEKRVAITFDATYGADNTEKILHILEENGVRATFFVSGIWVDAFPDITAKLSDHCCEVMSHSDTHPHLTQCSEEEIWDELESSSRKIEAVTGVRPTLMRCPYGEYDERVLKCVERMGMKAIQWSVDSLDWKETMTGEEIYERILSQVRPGGIIRCHNGGIYTPWALERVIVSLKEKGYQFMPVSDLLAAAGDKP